MTQAFHLQQITASLDYQTIGAKCRTIGENKGSMTLTGTVTTGSRSGEYGDSFS
ncbi:MAG: hypothetical protein WA125_01585 [Desulfosporosinus sp.]